MYHVVYVVVLYGCHLGQVSLVKKILISMALPG